MFLDSTASTTSEQIAEPAHPPSIRAERAARHEASLCLAGLDAVSTATGDLDLELRLAASVFGLRPYERLARYRRQYVLGYIHGARDLLARRVGRPTLISPLPDPSVPAHIQTMQLSAAWHRHPHGGGWVSSTAYVALTAYVGPAAVVMDRARVLDRARVYGGALVSEDAELCDSAQAHGRAVVAGTALLKGTARIAGEHMVAAGVFTAGRVRP